MLKKFLAGLTAIALSLGMVALTAAPASAHHNTIKAAVACNTGPDGFWKVTWTVENSEGIDETITSTSDASIVAKDTVIAGGTTLTVVKYYTTKPTSNLTLTLSAEWTNGQTQTNSGTLSKNDFKDNCVPDDTSTKVTICHANNGNGWTTNSVSINSIIEAGGHAVHQNGRDIIPPFNYVKQGVPGSFPGLNWDAYGQWVLGNGCSSDVPKPTKPTQTDAVCTAAGQSAGTVTIPSGATGFQYSYRYGNAGGWTDVAQGTVLSGVAFGTVVQVRATLLAGYTTATNWGPGWTKWQGSDDSRYTELTVTGQNSQKCVTPVAPTFQNAVCTDPGTGTTSGYYIVNGSGTAVKYEVRINNGSWVAVDPATFGVKVDVAPGTKVEVRATAPGYVLIGADLGPWSNTFTNPGDCLDGATPVKPTATQSQCTVPGQSSPASYLVTAAAGVRYEAGPTATGPWTTVSGSVPATAGSTVWVRAVAEAGYKLVAGYDGPWKLEFSNPGDCISKVTPATPTFTSAVCDPQRPGAYGQASYTIPSTTGVKYEVRTRTGGGWSAWTEKPADTYTVPAGAEVEVRAVALPGYTLEGTKKWSKDFTVPDCLTDVRPTAPTWTQAYCTGDSTVAPATYTIPAVTGLQYQQLVGLNWVDRAAGPHPTADGAVLTLRAVSLAGYEVVGQGLWVFWIPNIDASKDCIVPDEPTFDPQECTEPGDPSQATYTIPAESGVRYQIKDGNTWTTIDAGTYDVDDFPTTVEVRAVPKNGYHFLDGAKTSWTFDFVSAGDCIEDVEVGAVTKVDQTCVVEEDIDRGGKFGPTLRSLNAYYVSGYISIPVTPNVDYFIAPDLVNPVAQGVDYEFPPGTYYVHAVAHPGYQLTGYDGPFELVIAKAVACGDLPTNPDVLPVVTFVQTTCSASGSYTLGVDPVENVDGVIWTVSGGLPNTIGKHSVTTPGLVTIHAQAAPGYGFSGLPVNELDYEFTFAALPDDCLPTLALTGGAPAAGALGLGTLLTLGGVLLVLGRRRQELGAE